MSQQSLILKKEKKRKSDLVPSQMSIYGRPCVVVFGEDENALLSLNDYLSNFGLSAEKKQTHLSAKKDLKKQKKVEKSGIESAKKKSTQTKKGASYSSDVFSKKELKK